MAADLATRLKEEISSMRERASKHRKASKEEGMELLYDLGTTALTSGVGLAEGSGKLDETFEVMGYAIDTKLTAALVGKVLALATKGTARKISQEASRAMFNISGYSAAKRGAATK